MEIIIKSVNVFEEFIQDNVKADYYDIKEYKKEMIASAREGNTFYELGRHETKSGHAETIRFEYDYEYDENLGEYLNETITF